jgi:integrase
MAHEPITSHREALSRSVPASKDAWITVKNPLGYTGLYMRASKTGGRSYYYRFTMNGKQRKIFLGQLEDTYLNEAAEKHAELAKQVKAGVDVVAERQIAARELQEKAAVPVSITVKQLVEKWLKDHLEVNAKRCSYISAQNRIYKWIVNRWGNLAADSITPRHIIELRDEILKDGKHATSNAIVGELRQIYQYGVEELLVDANPAREIKRRGKVSHRTTAWSDAQIKEIWQALETEVNKPTELAVKLLMLTGCRRCEITSLEQSEVTLDEKTGTGAIELPPHRTKTNKRHYVYLPPLAADLVKQAIAASTNEKFVFGHKWKFKEGCPINEDTVSKTFTALLKKLGIPGVLHTCRHTVMTGCLKLGGEYSVVESLLNHAPAGTGAVYAKAAS